MNHMCLRRQATMLLLALLRRCLSIVLAGCLVRLVVWMLLPQHRQPGLLLLPELGMQGAVAWRWGICPLLMHCLSNSPGLCWQTTALPHGMTEQHSRT